MLLLMIASDAAIWDGTSFCADDAIGVNTIVITTATATSADLKDDMGMCVCVFRVFQSGHI